MLISKIFIINNRNVLFFLLASLLFSLRPFFPFSLSFFFFSGEDPAMGDKSAWLWAEELVAGRRLRQGLLPVLPLHPRDQSPEPSRNSCPNQSVGVPLNPSIECPRTPELIYSQHRHSKQTESACSKQNSRWIMGCLAGQAWVGMSGASLYLLPH